MAIIPSNRLTTWQGNVGVVGDIPSGWTIYVTLGPSATVADINAAIAACPANQVVKLGSYTYNINGRIYFQGKSNCILRGSGNSTVLNCTAALYGGNIFVEGPNTVYLPQNNPGHVVNWASNFTQGENQLTLSSVTGLSAGDYFWVDQLNDSAASAAAAVASSSYLVGKDFSYENCGNCGRSTATRSQQQMFRVASISGNIVTTTTPIQMPNWRITQTPQAWWVGSLSQNVGIEDLRIVGSNSEPWGIYGGNICFTFAANCWVKNVKSENEYRGYTYPISPSSHVVLYVGGFITIRHSHFYGTRSAASSSYGVLLFEGSNCLVEDNIFDKIVAPVILGSGATGNVIAYNFTNNNYYLDPPSYMNASFWSHDAHCCMNLFEGNYGTGVRADQFHGTASHQMVFRNRLTGYQDETRTNNRYPVLIDTLNRYWNYVGNVLGTIGKHTASQIFVMGNSTSANIPNDPYTTSTAYRHGNYDTATASITWDATNADHAIPNSLYLSSAPSWFGNLTWPPFDPSNPTVATTAIPAGYRFVNGIDPGGGPLPTPAISLNNHSLDFGFVAIGQYSDLVIQITNSGGGTLSGTATISGSGNFAITSGSSYSLLAGQSQNVFVRYTPIVNDYNDSASILFTGANGDTAICAGRSPFGLTFPSINGVIAAPFTIDSVNSVISQTVQTTTASQGGRAYYEFNAPSAGDFTVSALVLCPDGGSNSFFFNVDGEPDTNANEWEVPVTTPIASQPMKWYPESSAHVFTLAKGKHTLIVRGREANAKLGAITITSITAPTNQPPVAGLTSDVQAGVGPILVTFTLTSSDTDGTVASGVLSYGDGTSNTTISSPAASTTRTHTYAPSGFQVTWNATWTITDNIGATNQATCSITISATPPPTPNQSPLCSIAAAPLSGNSPLPVNFTLTCSDPDDSVATGTLDYGDGSPTEVISTPLMSFARAHTYTNAGPADVVRTASWQITDTHTATTTATAIITVSQPIAAAISVLPSSLAFGSVNVGASKTLSAVVKNIGGQTLNGTASVASPYSIQSGGIYSLAPGASQTVFVVYVPTTYSATNNASLTLTGGGGSTVSLTGTSPANIAPTVTLTSPINGATFTASVANPVNLVFGAIATDSDGTITKVEFYDGIAKIGEDTSAPHTLAVQYTSAGSHSITAKAIDSGGAATTSSPATLTLVAPVVLPPTVSITSPTQGSSFAFGAPITVQVTSSAVVKIEYYSDAMKIGQDTQTPHNFTWSNPAVGSHTMTAVATDNLGNTKTSNPIGIVVLASPPSNVPVPFIIYVNPS